MASDSGILAEMTRWGLNHYIHPKGDQMHRVTRMELVLAALLVAFGIAGGGYFIGQTLYNANVAINVTTMKGLAERRVEAGQARWKIEYSVVGSDKAEIPSLYDKSEANQAQIVDLLLANGFDEKDISPGTIDYQQREYRSKNQELVEVKYSLIGSIEVATDKVALISKIRSKVINHYGLKVHSLED